MIPIGVYIAANQPAVWRLLIRRYLCELVDWGTFMRQVPRSGAETKAS